MWEVDIISMFSRFLKLSQSFEDVIHEVEAHCEDFFWLLARLEKQAVSTL